MDISRSDRAKQFLPFDSLKGLQEALRKKENEHEENIKRQEGREKIDSDIYNIKLN